MAEEMKSEYDFSQAKRGAVLPVREGKTRITIRLDNDILDWFRDQVDRAGGGNYQTLINDALREYVSRWEAGQGEVRPAEELLRRLIREEISRMR